MGAQEADMEELQFKASLGKKSVRPYINKTSWVWWSITVTPATKEVEVGRLWSKAGPWQKCKTLFEK
jgi:hypothetical protein